MPIEIWELLLLILQLVALVPLLLLYNGLFVFRSIQGYHYGTLPRRAASMRSNVNTALPSRWRKPTASAPDH